MANELILNLDLDAKTILSNYALPINTTSPDIYFRPFKGLYLTDWSKVTSLNITFVDADGTGKLFTYELTPSNITNVDGEQLMKLTLSPSMTGYSTVYNGLIKINKDSTKSLKMDIAIFEKDSSELIMIRDLIRNYERAMLDYLKLTKKDMLDKPNGVAVLDVSKKILEKYLPATYKSHISAVIRNSKVHDIRLDAMGSMWYTNKDTGVDEKVDGQNASSGVVPPTITITEGLITVTHDRSTILAVQKWDTGERDIPYFRLYGNTMSGTTIKITSPGFYSYYYKTSDGQEFIEVINITDVNVPYPLAKLSIAEGVITVSQHDPSKVALQKWAKGSLKTDYFVTQGTTITNNKFIVADTGVYTVYYKLHDGREYVVTIVVKESDLPQDIMPTLTIEKGLVTVTFAPTMSVSESKWDILNRTVEYFSTAGVLVSDNQFYVSITGPHTYYFKTTRGKTYVIPFTVKSDQLDEAPIVYVDIAKSVATITYPQDFNVVLQKWELGIKDVNYFRTGGNEFTGDSFMVYEADYYTLYYKDEKGREYVKVFKPEVSELLPRIEPYYTIANGEVSITVGDQSIYTANLYENRDVRKDFFVNGGGNTVSEWKIPVVSKGYITHYYKVEDGRDGIKLLTIGNAELPHKNPTITVTNGLARVFHDQPPGITVVTQKWEIGNRNLEYFSNSGKFVSENKFYVTQSGIHTLYYQLSNGGEYAMTFNVGSGQLEKPVVPPTVEVTKGEATVTFVQTMNPVLKKWSSGKQSVPFFPNNGTEFNDKFIVPSAGEYTVYYKLDNDKEYVYHFTVTQSQMEPPFYPPTVSINRGQATVTYNPTMDVTTKKWTFGANTVEYFENNGYDVIDNKFIVTQAGRHTLYTVLEGKFKHVSYFDVKPEDLFIADRPPNITVANGTVTIAHDSSTKVALQKWDYGNNSVVYFENNGTTFTGSTFKVTRSGMYTYYYINTLGDKHVYPFEVKDTDLPFYAPVIEVFDGVMSVTFTSPEPPNLVKIDSGNRDIPYFASNGTIVTNNRHPITSAGQYTLYWRETSGLEYVTTFNVTTDQTVPHESPTIAVTNVYTVSVTYKPDVESLVTTKKWTQGEQNASWFDTNGTVQNNNIFSASGASGMCTYYYKYRTRGFTKNFYILIPPDIETKYGVTKVTLVDGAKESDIIERKWAVGSHNVEYFQSNGTLYTGTQFSVTEADMHSLYMKDVTGGEHVFLFTVTQNMLDVPTPTVTITDGVATVTYDQSESAVTLEKWNIGSRDVAYFTNNGLSILDHTFTVTEIGVHTLYYILENEYKFVKEFTVTEEMLPATATLPQEFWGLDKRFVWEWNPSDEMPTTTLLAKGVQDVAYFQGGNTGLALTELDSHSKMYVDGTATAGTDVTIYVKMSNGAEDVAHYMYAQDMLVAPTPPTFSVDTNAKTVAMSNIYSPIRLIENKWDRGQQTVAWFNTNGSTVIDNTVPMNTNGWMTVYYKYKTNVGYVFTYNVTDYPMFIENTKMGDLISIYGVEHISLGNSYAIRTATQNPGGSIRFASGTGEANVYVDPSNVNNIGYFLNTTYYNGLPSELRDAIITSTWNRNSSTGVPIDMKVGMITHDQYNMSGFQTMMNRLTQFGTFVNSTGRTWMASTTPWTPGVTSARPSNIYNNNNSSSVIQPSAATGTGYDIHPLIKLANGTPVVMKNEY